MINRCFRGFVIITASLVTWGTVVWAQTPGGTLNFNNRVVGAAIDARIFDVDGGTPLSGNDFLAQLYAGPSAETLAPAGPPVSFKTGSSAGYLDVHNSARELSNLGPGEAGYAQVRVWEAAFGTTYEESTVNGGRIGFSKVIPIVTGGAGTPPSLPVDLIGLESFRLEHGLKIDLQPQGQMVLVGERVEFRVVVSGSTPVGYQWLFNGVDIPGANGPVLVIGAASIESGGAYSVSVRGDFGSRTSRAARLIVVSVPKGATVRFSNHDPKSGLDSPVFDVDGVTPLSGSRFVAQLYAGPSATNLSAIGELAPFQDAPNAGYWDSAGELVRVIPGVEPGGQAFGQVWVWEQSAGKSYEAALAAGGRVGKSDLFEFTTGGEGDAATLPTSLIGLHSFKVSRLPQITWQVYDQRVFTGDSSTLFVQANGDGPLSYQWQFNETDLASGTNASYTVNNATTADSGNYRVMVSNSVGSVVSGSIGLTVLSVDSPLLILQPVEIWPIENFPIYTIRLSPIDGQVIWLSAAEMDWVKVLVPNQSVEFAFSTDIVLGQRWDGFELFHGNPVSVIDNFAAMSSRADAFPSSTSNGNRPGVPADVEKDSFQRGGCTDSSFMLTLRDATGPAYTIEGSTDFLNWQTLAAVTTRSNTLAMSESGAMRNSYRSRFYRARDVMTGQIASERIAGFVDLVIQPGTAIIANPLDTEENTIAGLLGRPPVSITVYQFDSAKNRYVTYTFDLGVGEWLENGPVQPGEGLLIQNSGTETLLMTVKGLVPEGDREQDIPAGWSLRGSLMPRAGALDSDFNLPFDGQDRVAFWNQDKGSLDFYDYESGGNWFPKNPSIEPGEGFWIWKTRSAKWHQSLSTGN